MVLSFENGVFSLNFSIARKRFASIGCMCILKGKKIKKRNSFVFYTLSFCFKRQPFFHRHNKSKTILYTFPIQANQSSRNILKRFARNFKKRMHSGKNMDKSKIHKSRVVVLIHSTLYFSLNSYYILQRVFRQSCCFQTLFQAEAPFQALLCSRAFRIRYVHAHSRRIS